MVYFSLPVLRPMSILSFSGKYEILDSYRNCERGKEITTEEECRATTQDLGLPPGDHPNVNFHINGFPRMSGDPRGWLFFSYKTAVGLPGCMAFPWKPHPNNFNPLRVHFNYAKVAHPTGRAQDLYRAICLTEPLPLPLKPGKFSFR